MFRDLNILNPKFENLVNFRLTILTFVSNLQEIARHGFNLVVPSHSGLIIHSPTVNLTTIHYIHRHHHSGIVYDSSAYERLHQIQGSSVSTRLIKWVYN